MRAIKYKTNDEAIENWNELEALCKHLHDEYTSKYTYVQGNILVLQEVENYEAIVANWIGEKQTFKYTPPQNDLD
jgi:hypothetical protein